MAAAVADYRPAGAASGNTAHMRSASPPAVEWHVCGDGHIPAEVADAAARGVPIIAHVARGVPIDGFIAELLEECATVVRYGA